MYATYGDESYDEKKQRVYAVAGLMTDERDWEDVQSRWVELTGGKEFHASECERTPEGLALYKKLVQALIRSKLFGWGAVMSLVDYGAIFDRPIDELPHYFCFTKVIEQFANRVSYLIPQDKVEFTFDQNLKTQHNSAFIYHYMTTLEGWEDRELVSDKISFASRKNPRIQAADLWAREVMKYGDECVKKNQPLMRGSFQALTDTKKFALDFFAADYFRHMKQQIMERHLPGHSLNEYDAWREKHRMQDTTENRIRYHIYLNTVEKSTGEKHDG